MAGALMRRTERSRDGGSAPSANDFVSSGDPLFCSS
jgi:hypothetical protein